MKKRKAFISFLMGVGLLGLFNACDEEGSQKGLDNEVRNSKDAQGRPTFYTDEDTIFYYDATIDYPWQYDEKFNETKKKHEDDRNFAANERRLNTYARFNLKTNTNGYVILCTADGVYSAGTFFKYAFLPAAGEYMTASNSYFTTNPSFGDHYATATFTGGGMTEFDFYKKNMYQNGISNPAGSVESAIAMARGEWYKYNVEKINTIEDVFYVPPEK